MPLASARRWFIGPWQTTNAARDLLVGLGLGIGAPVAILVVQLMCGWQSMTWHGVAPVDLITTVVTGALVGPVLEELVFRYLALRGLERWTGPAAAVAITALVFGLLHLISPYATPLGGLAATAAGLMFGAAYLATRTMWLPIASHVGWNLVTVVAVGVPVPGAHRLFHLTSHGLEVLSGGAYGPDASIITIVVCLAIAAWLSTAYRACVVTQLGR